MKANEEFKVGDIVHSKINTTIKAYEIVKANKMTCQVKVIGGTHIYKNVKYSILKKGRRNA